MRYYLYLDRKFLRMLFSVIDGENFDIEVVEFSVKKSKTTNNGVAISPNFENLKEECTRNPDENKINRENKKLEKDKIDFSYDYRNSSNIETQKKYINIEDITSMKNINFYHKLVEKMANFTENLNRDDKTGRICQESGYIYPYLSQNRVNSQDTDNNSFFKINDTIVLFDKSLLESSIEILSSIKCDLNVIGYQMNCRNESQIKVIKAIAIFIV